MTFDKFLYTIATFTFEPFFAARNDTMESLAIEGNVMCTVGNWVAKKVTKSLFSNTKL